MGGGELKLKDVLFLLKKRMAFILVATCAAAVISYAWSKYLAPPVFEARAALAVSAQAGKAGESSPARMTSVVGYVLKNPALLEKAAERLGLAADAEQLAEQVSVAEAGSSGILNLTVRDRSRPGAEAILDTLIELAPEETGRLLGDSSVKVIALSKQIRQVSPDTLSDALAGLLIGFSASCALVCLAEALSDKFVAGHDLESRLGWPVLAVVPKCRRKKAGRAPGGGETWPGEVHRALPEPFCALAINVRRALGDTSGAKIVVAGAMPGEGRTVVASGLASALGRMGLKVLLAGFGLRRCAAALTGGAGGAGGGAAGATSQAQAVKELAVRSEDAGVYLLEAGDAPDGPGGLLQPGEMKSLLHSLERDYDAIVLDTPPLLFSADALALSQLADGVLFVVAQSRTKRAAAEFAKKSLEMAGARVIGCVLNFFDEKKTNKTYTFRQNARQEPRPSSLFKTPKRPSFFSHAYRRLAERLFRRNKNP